MREYILRHTAAGDVWGIGRRIAAQLAEHGYLTAYDVAHMPAALARSEWSVVLERTVLELQGVSCISMDLAPSPKRQIACTRSFGRPVEDIGVLEEAVSEFASRASEKLRLGGQRAGGVHVFIRTSPFRKVAQFGRSVSLQMQPPTSDTKKIVAAAIRGLRSIYVPGFELSKAGVILLDLASSQASQMDWVAQEERRDQGPLMEAMDRLNIRFGKGSVHVGSTGLDTAGDSAWRQRQERRTPRYTTRLEEIPVVRA